jgi:hypothetical protein
MDAEPSVLMTWSMAVPSLGMVGAQRGAVAVVTQVEVARSVGDVSLSFAVDGAGQFADEREVRGRAIRHFFRRVVHGERRADDARRIDVRVNDTVSLDGERIPLVGGDAEQEQARLSAGTGTTISMLGLSKVCIGRSGAARRSDEVTDVETVDGLLRRRSNATRS